MTNHDKAKQMIGMFGIAVGLAYAFHSGSVASAAVGFIDELLMAGFFLVKRLF